MLSSYQLVILFISSILKITISIRDFPYYHGDYKSYDIVRPSLDKSSAQEARLQFNAFNNSFVIDLIMSRVNLTQNLPEYCDHYESKSEVTMATVSLCSDTIHAYILSKTNVYSVVPLDNELKEHVVYRKSDLNYRPRCGNNDHRHDGMDQLKQNNHDVLRVKRSTIKNKPYGTNRETRYIELFFSLHYEIRKKYTKNSIFDEEKLKRDLSVLLININKLFKSLNIFIVLTNYEVWDSFKINVSDDSASTLRNYLTHRKEINKKFYNDIGYFLTNKYFKDNVVGRATKKTICSDGNSGGIAYWGDHHQTALTIAHEIGHNFGMEHDENNQDCRSAKSIMAAKADLSDSIDSAKWSNCSREELESAYFRRFDICLHNLPKVNAINPICGNRILEGDEECDCGTEEECDNNCCHASNCTLTAGSQCSYGKCCSECKFIAAATICRESKNECDLPEACSGKDSFCPEDVFKQTGYSCEGNTNYCHLGQCVPSLNDQCNKIWRNSKVTDLCYKWLLKTREFCGAYNYNTKTYDFCTEDNYLCSPLICMHKQESSLVLDETYRRRHYDIRLTNSESICTLRLYDVGRQARDPGLVQVGSSCGNGRICVDQTCVNASATASTCGKCNGKGICNSLKQCHCDKGFAPPNCDKPGGGGSLHSNSLLPRSEESDSNRKGTIIAVVIVILLFFIFMAVGIFFAVNRVYFDKVKRNIPFLNTWRRKSPRQQWERNMSCSYRDKTISNPVMRQSSNKRLQNIPPLRPPPPDFTKTVPSPEAANHTYQNTQGSTDRPVIAPKPVKSAYVLHLNKENETKLTVC